MADAFNSSSSLKRRTLAAGTWSLIGHAGGLALRLGGTIIFTRLFAPDVFGILALVMSVQFIITLLSDIGLRQFVEQNPMGDDPTFLNTAWSVQIVQGFIIWAGGLLVAFGLFATGGSSLLPHDSIYSNPDLPALIAVSSSVAAIYGLRSINILSAGRHLNPKPAIALELLQAAAYLVIVITVSFFYRSIWTLVAGYLCSTVVVVVASHLFMSGPRRRLGWDRDTLRALHVFGRWIFLSSAVVALAINGDKLLLAGWISPALLGYYAIASNLVQAAESAAGRVIAGVALPAFSTVARTQPERFQEVYYKMRWVTDAAIIGTAGFLFAISAKLVAVLYDPRYAPVTQILQILSFSLLFSRYGLMQSAFLALHRPSYVTVFNVVKVISLFTIVPIAFFLFGLEGAVIGIAFHTLPATLCYLFLGRSHGLTDLRFELGMLMIWPIGWLAGWLATEAMKLVV